ncbi:hypothetical protein ACO2Q1_09340 [Brevundimonas sp. VNH65]|uniref:hypothetical protein n=1 Tax=Brevundimonas sp. VNH65 TaxID=3400917 RepID=UPI003C050ECF
MRSRLAVIVLIGTAAGLVSCKGAESSATTPPGAADAVVQAPAPSPAAPTAEAPRDADAPVPAAESGAPAFAVVYPGGRVETATDEAAPTNALAFTTEATPEEVVEFYRRKAVTAGLLPVMSMNQGDVRGYGASDADGGTHLRVLAHPDEAGRTAVQLSWTDGG